MSSPQIWNIETEKYREKEKQAAGKRSSTRKKGRQRFGAEKKKQRRHFFVERTTKKFCSSGDKIRNASGHKCKVKMSGSEKK